MRRVNNKIEFFETGVFKVSKLSESYFYDWFIPEQFSWKYLTFFSSYQICNVYTDKGTALDAMMKLNGAESTYILVFDSKTQIVEDPEYSKIIKKVNYNDIYNCHGYTFLDGVFWFLIDNQMVDTIIKDDGYGVCKRSELREKGVALYYNKWDELIHSGRMHDGVIKSKFGINDFTTIGEEQIFTKYKRLNIAPEKTKYFNR